MIVLSLGSNIEPRVDYIETALSMLEKNDIKIKKISSFYETEAWGGVAKDDFLNICATIECSYDAYTLLNIINKIEKDLGRVRKEHWGNRTIDIDIIKFNDDIYNDEKLIIPHKYLHERVFVLVPMLEICGDLKISGELLSNSLKTLNSSIKIYKIKRERELDV